MDDLQIIADKIRTMEIRGAGRIAVAASAALRDYAKTLRSLNIEEFNRNIDEAAKTLVDTRPTAVSLPNAVALTKRHSSTNVYDAIDEIVSNSDEFIKNAEEALGKNISVIATESRPRRQGFITIRELNDYGIPTTLIVDSAVRLTMKEVDLVVVGADSISVNGALINKIGTSQLAMAAQEARRNLIVAAETYKFSPRTLLGEMVEIEDRGSEEVIDPEILEELPNVKVRNPAFDVTPAEYIDLIITEVGALPPAMAYTIIKDHLGLEMLP